MFLLGKGIPPRNRRPPLIQGLIGRIDAEDEGKFAAFIPVGRLMPGAYHLCPQVPQRVNAQRRATSLSQVPKDGLDG
jgi:hypothetical protein